MRLVIQRALKVSLSIGGEVYSKIEKGLLVFVGVEHSDDNGDATWLAKKLVNLRIFSDEQGKMNLSVSDINGEIMIVSQFTLHASTKKGNRPSYIRSANPDKAKDLYLFFIDEVKNFFGKQHVKTGVFGANMQISFINDGPVTIIMDTKNKE